MTRPMLPLLLALAVLARLIVPDGWMPSGTGAAFAIEPCPAAGPLAVTPMHHGTGQQHLPEHGSRRAADCPFAPLVAAGLSPVAVADLTTPLPADALPHWRPRPTTFLAPGTSRPPPSTGPPALA